MRGEAVNATALSNEFEISEDAIRRDLRALAAEGVCRRVYGGALPISPASAPMRVRQVEQGDRKAALARTGVDLIGASRTLFLDTGSTILSLAGFLPRDLGLTVVTNSIAVAAVLADRTDLDLVMIGGAVDPITGGCVSARALGELQRYRIDLCFLGACALSVDDGLAGFEMADVDFKRALIEVSEQTILMMLNPKLETTAPHRIGRIDAIDHLILEADAPTQLFDRLQGVGPSIHRAETAHD